MSVVFVVKLVDVVEVVHVAGNFVVAASAAVVVVLIVVIAVVQKWQLGLEALKAEVLYFWDLAFVFVAASVASVGVSG